MKRKAIKFSIVWTFICVVAAFLSAADSRYGKIVDEDAPLKKQVKWYIKASGIPVHLPLDYESEGLKALGRIREDMEARPDKYFPLLVRELNRSDSLGAETVAIRTLADTMFVESHREEVRAILRSYITGERKPRNEPQKNWHPVGAAISHYPKVARGPEDAWELLPHVETEYGSTAINAISKIADPSIIPELEKRYPEWFELPQTQSNFIQPIRARHPDWEEQRRSEPEAPRRAEPEKAAPPSEAEAEEPQEPPKASESSEEGEASKGSLALWAAAVAGALAVATLAARRRAGKR